MRPCCCPRTLSLLISSNSPVRCSAWRCHRYRACTFDRAGESSRSKFNVKRNVIVVNKARRDFAFAARGKALKLHYLVRLYAKQLVMHNFSGLRLHQLLEFPCVDEEHFWIETQPLRSSAMAVSRIRMPRTTGRWVRS